MGRLLPRPGSTNTKRYQRLRKPKFYENYKNVKKMHLTRVTTDKYEEHFPVNPGNSENRLNVIFQKDEIFGNFRVLTLRGRRLGRAEEFGVVGQLGSEESR
jgi:ACT domain-containing protein